MPYRPSDTVDLRGDLQLVSQAGNVFRLHLREDGTPCLYVQDEQTGDLYEVCMTVVGAVEPPTPVAGEILHGTGLVYAAFGPQGTQPTAPPAPSTAPVLWPTAYPYAAFTEYEV